MNVIRGGGGLPVIRENVLIKVAVLVSSVRETLNAAGWCFVRVVK